MESKRFESVTRLTIEVCHFEAFSREQMPRAPPSDSLHSLAPARLGLWLSATRICVAPLPAAWFPKALQPEKKSFQTFQTFQSTLTGCQGM